MERPTALDIARKLISFDTAQPTGSEQAAAAWLAELLADAGLDVRLHEFAAGRTSVVARLEGSGRPPLCFTGHLDTVPLGATPWQRDPYGEVADGRLYGRGASDMKAGVAAITAAALDAADGDSDADLCLIFTAGEEQGCLGSKHLAASAGALPAGGALVVAEPTSNHPVCCHRGALWLDVTTRGRTAHGSTPHLGENAIYKAAGMIGRLAGFAFDNPPHALLGLATLNVGTMAGGQNINSVPDRAGFTIDIRTLPGMDHGDVLETISDLLGAEAAIEKVTDLAAVFTDPGEPWMIGVRATAEGILGCDLPPIGKLAFTDAAVLKSALGGCPTVILGPGISEQCHRTDEHCLAGAIDQTVEIYAALIRDWRMK